MKPEGAAGDQADLGVDRLHAGVGEAVADRRDDPLPLLGDRARQLDEGPQATAPRPGEPLIQQADRRPRPEPVDLAQLLLQQVGPVQGPVYPLDVGEL